MNKSYKGERDKNVPIPIQQHIVAPMETLHPIIFDQLSTVASFKELNA